MANNSHPHNWVEVRVVSVSITENRIPGEEEEGKLHIYSSPEAIEIAEEDLSYICYDCKANPQSEAFHEPCPGAVRTALMDDQ